MINLIVSILILIMLIVTFIQEFKVNKRTTKRLNEFERAMIENNKKLEIYKRNVNKEHDNIWIGLEKLNEVDKKMTKQIRKNMF